ncbi:hypothetical protein M569_16358 [Genlisea aurea]|uniref:Uncharacterized protein n=1 Tax=Genlisea aurea TaxID=192259 RepID=S8C213_9LAMI|nr:hypothetical protein M569_16358 [Genlisea aurea]
MGMKPRIKEPYLFTEKHKKTRRVNGNGDSVIVKQRQVNQREQEEGNGRRYAGQLAANKTVDSRTTMMKMNWIDKAFFDPSSPA